VQATITPIVWLTAPDCDGWWIAARFKDRFSDRFSEIALIEIRAGLCFTEHGHACGMPATENFHGTRWLGPVDRPAGPDDRLVMGAGLKRDPRPRPTR
jgi:hypothetical protein